MRAAAYAEARWILENPKWVRFGFVEMLWAGEMTRAVRERTIRRYIEMVDAGREVTENPKAIPALTAEGMIGSITEMLMKKLQRDRPPNPYDFVPELMYLAVRPYLGEEAAQRELTMPRPEGRAKRS